MNDDPIAHLERELLAAARRRREPTARPQRRNHGLLPLAASLLVTVAVAAGLLATRGDRTSRHAAAPPSQLSVTDRRLVAIIGVLRRPQTALDRRILRQSGLLRGSPFGRPLASSARLATITPWGSRVLFVLFASQTGGPAAPGQAVPPPFREGGLTVQVDHADDCCASAASIAHGGDLGFGGAGHSFAGGATGQRAYVVVPDGVARVSFISPPHSVLAGGPTYRRGLRVTVPVSGNVAAVQWHRQCCDPPLMVWYARDGRIIRRVGNFAAAGHPRAVPQPAPETALSRRAQRDPATPNPVTVTPAIGPAVTSSGRRSHFVASFRILVNDADYRYWIRGPRGCGLTGGIGGGGSPLDIRGQRFTILLPTPGGGGWCMGSYHVSVGLLDLGRAGGLHGRRPVPFGSTSFTVRR